jgi:hypothetical protein
MEKPHVQFARTRDGVTIAYRSDGQGQPILFLTAWVSHLESDSRVSGSGSACSS